MVVPVVGSRSAAESRAQRVAFAIDKYPPFVGGAEYQAELLAGLLAAQHWASHVYTAQRDARADTPGVSVHRIGTSRPHRLRHPANFAAALRTMLLHAGRYSIVHGYALSGLTCGAILAARLRRRPRLVKVCSTGPDGDVAKLARQPLGRWLWPLVRRSCAFVVPSPDVVGELIASGVSEGAITVIPNALRPGAPEPATLAAKLDARAELGLPDRATVLFVGRLAPEKGLDLLSRAWERVARECDATLVVVGAGAWARRLADWAGRSGHDDRVRLMGTRHDVERFYRAADVLVVPSRTETFSNVMAEGMAHGLAVVTTPVGLAGHWIHHGDSGLVVGGDDERDMAAAVTRVVREPSLREGLGRAARRQALAAFDPRSVVERYVDLYRRLT
jgi:glycosyltransferase involved in cell wall biosynthesis